MKKGFHKVNNEGSTLITVIICIALVGILASMMLSAAMSNLQMKIVESRSGKNFYSCEAAMEEIRTGLEEMVADKIREVYEEKVLANYDLYKFETEDERNDLNHKLQDMVALMVIKELGNTTEFVNDEEIRNAEIIDPISSTKLMDYLYLSYVPEEDLSIKAEYKSVKYDTQENTSYISVILEEINVEYVEDDYMTTISTNIKINIPIFSFEDGDETVKYGMEPMFPGYTIITDGEIKSANLTGNNIITGDIYAGEDIIIESLNGNHVVLVNADNIVTRGNIIAQDTASLKIEGRLMDVNSSIPVIWARNLFTKTSVNYDTNTYRQATIDIDGICVIKDDLSLEGINSNVNIDGVYMGYTGTHTSEGSAIMVNGSGSSLDLSGLNTLILAGRAHISVNDNNNVDDEGTGRDTDILTGESLGFKSNQRAYLIPGKYIDGVNHNPVREADFEPDNPPNIIIPQVPNPSEIDYINYVKVDSPYKIAAKQTGEGLLDTSLRYYYLNFDGGKAADDFMREYWKDNDNKIVLNNIEPFKIGSVKLPEEGNQIISVGNLMIYSPESGVNLVPGLSENEEVYNNDEELNDYIKNLEIDEYLNDYYELNQPINLPVGSRLSHLPMLYSRITHLLSIDENTKVYKEDDEVVASNISSNSIGDIVSFGQQWDDYTDSTVFVYDNFDGTINNPVTDKYLVLVDNYAVIETGSNFNGTFIVDGDVIIENGSVINGLLIASGNINIGNDVEINGMIMASGKTDEYKGVIDMGNRVNVNGRLVSSGDINLGLDCTLMVDKDIEDYITDMINSNIEVLRNLLRNYKMTIIFRGEEPVSSLADLSGMIYYENWKKY